MLPLSEKTPCKLSYLLFVIYSPHIFFFYLLLQFMLLPCIFWVGNVYCVVSALILRESYLETGITLY